MRRYFIELSYDGTLFHGWQIQPNASTVQEHLDKALSTCFRQAITTLGCGRTDTGVHATQFYVHFDLKNIQRDDVTHTAQADPLLSVAGINALLPYQIAVKRVFEVSDSFHARFDAIERAYQYHLHFHKDPFKLNRSWLYKGNLDVAAMNEAAKILLQHTDFSCFSKSNTQTFTNNCKVTEAWFQAKDDGLIFTIRANRFLRNMVRAIVGTLIRVGENEIDLMEFKKIIASKDRSNAGQSVPACGLYLVNVIYPFIK